MYYFIHLIDLVASQHVFVFNPLSHSFTIFVPLNIGFGWIIMVWMAIKHCPYITVFAYILLITVPHLMLIWFSMQIPLLGR